MSSRHGGKVLRFAVSGALLVGTALPACGGEPEAEPERPTINEPAPREPEPEPEREPREPPETANEPAPAEDLPPANEPAPSE